MKALGETANKLKENFQNYRTIREAAKDLGVSATRISVLCKKLNIVKWRNRSRPPETAAKTKIMICQNELCGKEFIVLKNGRSPHRFCCKKCQGQFVGRHYGFKSRKVEAAQ